MTGVIASSQASATEAASSLKKGNDSFSQITLSAQAGLGTTTPAAQHDSCASSLKSALEGYCNSLLRDADAIEKIAASFDETDKRLAGALLG